MKERVTSLDQAENKQANRQKENERERKSERERERKMRQELTIIYHLFDQK